MYSLIQYFLTELNLKQDKTIKSERFVASTLNRFALLEIHVF